MPNELVSPAHLAYQTLETDASALEWFANKPAEDLVLVVTRRLELLGFNVNKPEALAHAITTLAVLAPQKRSQKRK